LAEDDVEAVVERVERVDDTAAPDPDEVGAEVSQELARQLATRIVPGQKKGRRPKIF
jgi:hypothetical protein